MQIFFSNTCFFSDLENDEKFEICKKKQVLTDMGGHSHFHSQIFSVSNLILS